MKEYTILALVSALASVVLDRILGTRVVTKKTFWIAMAIMMFFKIPFNGYLTWRPVVLYNPVYFLNVRLGTIPVEDFFYGFGLITSAIVLWEYFLRREERRDEV